MVGVIFVGKYEEKMMSVVCDEGKAVREICEEKVISGLLG